HEILRSVPPNAWTDTLRPGLRAASRCSRRSAWARHSDGALLPLLGVATQGERRTGVEADRCTARSPVRLRLGRRRLVLRHLRLSHHRQPVRCAGLSDVLPLVLRTAIPPRVPAVLCLPERGPVPRSAEQDSGPESPGRRPPGGAVVLLDLHDERRGLAP